MPENTHAGTPGRKAHNMKTLGFLELIMAVLGLIASFIVAVESPGGGPEKRATVIKTALNLIAKLTLPPWARWIFGNEVVLGILVDCLVAVLNKTGEWVQTVEPTVQLTSLEMGGAGSGGIGLSAGIRF